MKLNPDKRLNPASDFDSLAEKQREELKREKMFDPVQRWKAIQEMITWAEQNMPPHLRRNRPRTHPANTDQK